MKALQQDGMVDRPQMISKMIAADLEQMVSTDSFEQTIANFDKCFTRDLVVFLDKLYSLSLSTDTVGSLVARLDFNGYYQERVRSQT